MNTLGLIPARAGSKGLYKKNIKDFCGKPLIHWTIKAAIESSSINRVIVSTESEEIKKISLNSGAEVPFLRPSHLAKDDSLSIDVTLDLINNLKDIDEVILLQPTSPLRTTADIDASYKFRKEKKGDSLVSYCKSNKHPSSYFKINKEGFLEPYISFSPNKRRQEYEETFLVNGAIYIASTKFLKENRSFISSETIGFKMPLERSIDIDDLSDWIIAESLFKTMN